jgi:hypothetical protein
MRRTILMLTALALMAPAAASAQGPEGAQSKAGPRQCFFSRDWRGWKAIDSKGLYARIGLDRVFRVDFANGCPGLTSPATHLVTSAINGQVCDALDLDVKVSDLQGFATPCIVTGVTALTPAQIAALPKKLTP